MTIPGSEIPSGHEGYEEATEGSCKTRCINHDDLDTPCKSVTYKAEYYTSSGMGNCILRSVNRMEAGPEVDYFRDRTGVDYFEIETGKGFHLFNILVQALSEIL